MDNLEIWRWMQEGYLVGVDETDGVRCVVVVERNQDGSFTVIKEARSRIVIE